MVMQQDLSAGIAAARAGDRARAQVFFARAVKANPQSEEAWLQLGLALEEPKRREYCFQQVLRLNPQNEQARRQLAGAVALSVDKPSDPTPTPFALSLPSKNLPPNSEGELSRPSLLDRRPTDSQKREGAPTVMAGEEGWTPRHSPGQLADRAAKAPPGVTQWIKKQPAPQVPPDMSVAAEAPSPTRDVHVSPTAATVQLEALAPTAPEVSGAAPVNAPIGLEKTIVVLLGVVVGLLLCGGPILFVVQTGRVDPLLPVALVPPFVPTSTSMPTASATATATPTPLPPTPTPSVTPTFTKQQKAELAADDAARAEELMSQGSFAEAIAVWDRVIAAGPDNGNPYYRRAFCYVKLLENQRTMSEYADYANRALADSDKAIALEPTVGDYYSIRASAYSFLRGVQTFRVDRDRLTEIEVENMRMALALGSGQVNELDLAEVELTLGHCDEYLATLNRLIAGLGKNGASDPHANALLSDGYLCKGMLDEALQHVDTALKKEPTSARRWQRAIILTNMGRLDEALAEINAVISEEPYYYGSKYYLRALIYYDLKKPDLAKKDLVEGSTQTWSQYDLRSYVLGRLALDAGDKKTGIEQLKLAEATFSHGYGPLIDRVRRELRQLNVAPLAPTVSVTYKATPIAIPKATATPLKPKVKSP